MSCCGKPAARFHRRVARRKLAGQQQADERLAAIMNTPDANLTRSQLGLKHRQEKVLEIQRQRAIAEQMKKSILGVIVTRVRKDDIEMQPETVKEMLEVPILGMVPEDICVAKSLNMKDAVVHTHPKSNASRAYNPKEDIMMSLNYTEN